MPVGNMDRLVGRLEAQFTTLNESIKAMAQESKEQRQRTAECLDALRADMTDLREDVAELRNDMAKLDARIRQVEPVAENISRWSERLIGMRMMLVIIGGMIGSGATMGWQKIAALWQ